MFRLLLVLVVFALLMAGCRFGPEPTVTPPRSASPTGTLTPAGDVLRINGVPVRRLVIPSADIGPLYALAGDTLFHMEKEEWAPIGNDRFTRRYLVDPEDLERVFRGRHRVCGASPPEPDVPMEVSEPFALAAIMAREDPRDAFVSAKYASLESLPEGARVGTSSLRRAAQIRRAFPKLEVLPLRGNVNTRLARLDEGRYDAIVLAAAGLKRLGLAGRIRAIVPPSLCLPAAGQGALGIETLATRDDLRAWLAPLGDARTAVEVHAERTVSRLLGGSCRVPLAAWCVTTPQGGLKLVARVAAEDGSAMVEAVAECAGADREAAGRIGEDAARSLREQGAARWLGSS